MKEDRYLFQSLSGLTLGLNSKGIEKGLERRNVSIPFRADTGFELIFDLFRDDS